MDSADLEPVRHAVSSQGAILGQHSTALQEIMGKLQDLSLRMETLQDSLQDPPPAPGLVASAAANPPREPWVSPPERYDGNLGQCKTFLMQCGLVFALQPLTYATERSKIAYLIGLLRGAALEWASVHWRRQDQVTTTYVAFTTEMTKVFDHPVQGNDASMRLFSLHQGLRSVAEYAIEFRTLAVESGWNDESLLAVFINGLSERLLQWGHSSRLSCHPGVARTLAFLRRRFWWPEMRTDVQTFVSACPVCAQNKGSNRPPPGYLQPLPIPRRPWSHLSLDFVSGLPPSKGMTVVFTVVDRFSKFARYLPLPKLPTAKETAELLVSVVSTACPWTSSRTEVHNSPQPSGSHSAEPSGPPLA